MAVRCSGDVQKNVSWLSESDARRLFSPTHCVIGANWRWGLYGLWRKAWPQSRLHDSSSSSLSGIYTTQLMFTMTNTEEGKRKPHTGKRTRYARMVEQHAKTNTACKLTAYDSRAARCRSGGKVATTVAECRILSIICITRSHTRPSQDAEKVTRAPLQHQDLESEHSTQTQGLTERLLMRWRRLQPCLQINLCSASVLVQ